MAEAEWQMTDAEWEALIEKQNAVLDKDEAFQKVRSRLRAKTEEIKSYPGAYEQNRGLLLELRNISREKEELSTRILRHHGLLPYG